MNLPIIKITCKQVNNMFVGIGTLENEHIKHKRKVLSLTKTAALLDALEAIKELIEFNKGI